MQKAKLNRSGQSLFELVVAVVVVGIILVALVGLVTKSISNATFSRNKTLATRYVQDAMEWMRVERDTDWEIFRDRIPVVTQTFCMQNLTWTAGECNLDDYISGTFFVREVVLTRENDNEVDAAVVVSWKGPSGMHESRATTRFTNWRNL